MDASLPTVVSHWSLWSLVPAVDGQTILSIAIGGAISFLTFWLGYHKSQGAQDERIRAASAELIGSVLKRVAVERESIPFEMFNELKLAKAYRSGIAFDRLITFKEAKAVVLLDVVDNNFLDQSSKNAIIDLLAQSRDEPETNNETFKQASRVRDNSNRAVIAGVFSMFTGVIAGFISYIVTDDPEKFDGIAILKSGLQYNRALWMLFVFSFMIGITYAFLSLYLSSERRRRQKEAEARRTRRMEVG